MPGMGWDHLTAAERSGILQAIERGDVEGGPLHAEIHPTDRCQARCTFCSTDDWRDGHHMEMDRFRRIVEELRVLGTKSVRVAGGGEPLHHPEIGEMLRHLRACGIAVENLTTNGIQLTREIAETIVAVRCDRITISLNSGSPETYAAMMGVPGSLHPVVARNIRGLVEAKRSARSGRPAVTIQFLVHKGNFREVPAMYRIACELDVDKIVFDGLAYLEPHERMTESETAEMKRLFRQVCLEDRFYRIARICSHEQAIEADLWEVTEGVGSRGIVKRKLRRLLQLLTRRDLGGRARLDGLLRALRKELDPPDTSLELPCFVGFHSPTIRASGAIAMCCTVQDRIMGHADEGIERVWRGPAYRSLRRQRLRIMREGESWTFAPEHEGHVVPMCAGRGFAGCRTRDFFYVEDAAFVRRLNRLLGRLRRERPPAAALAVSLPAGARPGIPGSTPVA